MINDNIPLSEMSVKEISHYLSEIKNKEKKRILNNCKLNIQNNLLIADEIKRVENIKILIALIPETINTIKKLLLDFSDEISYERHFTLFCYLDDVFDFLEDIEIINEILDLIKNYLLNVKYDYAMAAWMAGDLLGDHWRNIDSAQKVLFEVIKNSKYTTGKLSALHGIKQLFQNVDLTRKEEIMSFLQGLLKTEKSVKVKDYINLVLKKWKKL